MAALTTNIVQVIEVPRALLAEFYAMDEAQRVGVYFLIGDNEASQTSSVYIGQTGELGKRLSQHNKTKEFWNRALVVISLTNSLTQTHALFLEWLSIKLANEVGRYSVENGNSGSEPFTPKPLEADCHDIFDTMRMLLATLGQPIFEPLAKPKDVAAQNNELFFCAYAGTDATGEYTEEGFVVLKGSKGRLEMTPSRVKAGSDKRRQALIEDGTLAIEGSFVVFQKAVLFKTPSGASDMVTGASTNGWTLWRTKGGKTLDELKRNVPQA
ncbi:GIY-YIG nuclease family protein [Scleromatobacter humisilvae]|uniref:GIY-YIG nuclease family protein n=1 Tax=Scleromatobacter humisilvae TaxID=2897159 RepID=A0A9X1YRI6_9BURK|nr:GIY-YIG nuclease family protein [Scleromatobacter humisilvae]MCK9687336.1 GIY-YIG nuclease family protein [Scleromatobacter humisilvae]